MVLALSLPPPAPAFLRGRYRVINIPAVQNSRELGSRRFAIARNRSVPSPPLSPSAAPCLRVLKYIFAVERRTRDFRDISNYQYSRGIFSIAARTSWSGDPENLKSTARRGMRGKYVGIRGGKVRCVRMNKRGGGGGRRETRECVSIRTNGSGGGGEGGAEKHFGINVTASRRLYIYIYLFISGVRSFNRSEKKRPRARATTNEFTRAARDRGAARWICT